MSMIVNALSYIHPDYQPLFHNLHFSLQTGEKAALVGNNGSGKSTLLQTIAGYLKASAGESIFLEKPYYVPQQLGQYDAYTVAELLGIDQKLKALYAILAGNVEAENFTELGDDWEIEERVQEAMAYWQIEYLALSEKVKNLSGGEKTKVFLAGASLASPKVMLLDEPTNHLDSQSRELLYEFVNQSKSTMLVVSHDRTLLNLLDQTLELSANGIEVYGGNYAFYEAQKEGKLNALQSKLEENEKTLKQTQQKAREVAEQRNKKEARGKAHGQKLALPKILANRRKSQAEQSTAKLKEVHQEKMNELTDHLRTIRTQIQHYQTLRIDLGSSDLHPGKLLIEAKSINFSYQDQMLWQKPLTIQIRSGERIRISGNNGSGKTTLLKLLMGDLVPGEGEIFKVDSKFLYLDQEYAMIDNGLTIIEQIEKYNSRHVPEHELKMLLHQHQFPKEAWDRKCEGLSGGEKMKLSLCCLSVSTDATDLLILDEPTNNLDVQSQKVLTESLKSFKGAMLIISHDLFFINEMQIDSTISL
ncbi:ABC transporter ATP-binding protein [Siphonobacter sp. SORGH_AS_0500]|uniref:ABC-F family ATP-binding cassette domain-containing protein n=1 Tax=Siphonobacter sp. SORGH_AS_0500 TaxID=1864824 RepID=UPI000CB73F75|nr:ABC-F family ATP-binding cassette domain-containing protein [Siphonobacter sp. SORGH_AS_0500]PKK37064.1 ABC transporter ATP-binding protein [Siphonobacter sp. SORGH_AS_0500]